MHAHQRLGHPGGDLQILALCGQGLLPDRQHVAPAVGCWAFRRVLGVARTLLGARRAARVAQSLIGRCGRVVQTQIHTGALLADFQRRQKRCKFDGFVRHTFSKKRLSVDDAARRFACAASSTPQRLPMHPNAGQHSARQA
jgi:hypothetical protein